MACVEAFQAEFTRRKVFFQDATQRELSAPRFCSHQGWILGHTFFRVSAFLLSLITTIVDDATADTYGVSYIYLTTWSFLSLTIYFLFASISSVYYLCTQRATRRKLHADSSETASQENSETVQGIEETPLPWFMKIQWIFYNISLPSSGLVTVTYWGVFYSDQDITYNNIAVHVVNFVLMVTEQYISSVNTRILHFYQPVIFGLSYACFTIILWRVAGTIVYPVIDWENTPGLAAIFVLGIAFVYTIAQFILFLISYGLTVCSRKYNLIERD